MRSSAPPQRLMGKLFCTVIHRGEAGVSSLCPFYYTLPSFLSTPDSSETSCSANVLHFRFHSINIYPRLSHFHPFHSLSPLRAHLSPIPCGSAGYTPHSKTENHVTRSGSIRVHLLPGAVLYNDTYITCLQQWQSVILALYNTTALLKRKRKKNPDSTQTAEEPALRFPVAHEVAAHGIQ